MLKPNRKQLNRYKKTPSIYTSQISATSSLTINLGNYNSGKVEFSEVKTIQANHPINLTQEKKKLWDEVNKEVDTQIGELKDAFTKK